MENQDKDEAQFAELTELMEEAEADDEYMALIFSYTGKEVALEIKRNSDQVLAWLVAHKVGPRPGGPDLLAAVQRACRRVNLNMKSRPRG